MDLLPKRNLRLNLSPECPFCPAAGLCTWNVFLSNRNSIFFIQMLILIIRSTTIIYTIRIGSAKYILFAVLVKSSPEIFLSLLMETIITHCHVVETKTDQNVYSGKQHLECHTSVTIPGPPYGMIKSYSVLFFQWKSSDSHKWFLHAFTKQLTDARVRR